VYSTYAAATAACPSCIGLAGCTIQTDPVTGINNVNYDPLAVCDDGSCIACVDGCTDGTIGAPFLPDVYGFCINGVTPSPNTGLCDPNEGYAVNNYDPNATCDDGSCVVGLLGCTDPTALNYNSLATVDDGTCVFCTTPCCATPCTSPTSDNPDINGVCRDGTNVGYPNAGGCGSGNGWISLNYDPSCNPNCPSNCNPPCIYGCTDPNALNYTQAAYWDDGSCIFTGCTDPAGLNNMSNYVYIPNFGTSQQGGQIPLVSPGNLFPDNTQCCGGGYGNTSCGDCTALNYDPLIGTLSQQGLINALCVDNSLCNYGATPPTVTMQKINHTDTTYSSSQILGFAGYSGSGLWNGMVAPSSTPSFDTIQKTKIKGDHFGYNNWYTSAPGSFFTSNIGVNSSLVYQPNSGPQITLADGTTADGKAVILEVIKNANQGGGLKLKDVDFLPVWGPGNIVYPPNSPYGQTPWITTVHITGNGTCTENHDIFTDGIPNTSLGPFTSSNPGSGLMTVTLHVDMTDYNTNNNCNIADLMLTDSKSLIYGCMQPSAINYNSSANVQDCSCVFV